jgi:RTA1 like protein
MLFVLPPNSQRLLGVSPRLITRVFVGFDIMSLLIQCSGSGVASSQNWVGNTGKTILIAGLATQLATNVVFTVLVAAFYKRAFRERAVGPSMPEGWETAFWVVVSSIILVLVSV